MVTAGEGRREGMGRWTQQWVTAGDVCGGRGRCAQQGVTAVDVRGGVGEWEMDTAGGHNKCGAVEKGGRWTQQGVTACEGRGGG